MEICVHFSNFLRNTRRRRWLLQFTPKIEKFLFQDFASPPICWAQQWIGLQDSKPKHPMVVLQHLFKRQFVFLPHDQNRSTDLSENHPTWKLLGVPKNYVLFRREMREEVKRNRIHTRNLFTLAAKISMGKCWGTHLSFQWWGMDFRARNNWRVIFQKSKNKNPSYPKPVFKKIEFKDGLDFNELLMKI